MEKDIKVQDLQKYCRTCLNQVTGCKHNIDEMPQTIFQLFKQVTGYRKSRKCLYPNWICDTCCEKIKSFDEFQALSKKSTQFLEKLLKSYEPNDDMVMEYQEQEEVIFTENLKSTIIDEKLEEENQIGETLQADNNFEKIFFEEEIKTEQYNNVQYNLTIPMQESESIKVEESSEKNQKNDQSTTCKICKLTYSNVSVLKTHLRVHQNLRPFKCQQCSRAFNRKSHLKRHIEEVHAEFPIEIVCKYGCGKIFFRTPSAKAHYRNKHSSDEVVCQETPLADNESLLVKLNENSSKESDDSSDDNMDLFFMSKTTCKICQRTLSSTSALKSHLRVHEEKRPFQCDKCDRGFNKRSRLKEHIEETHSEKPLEILCKYGCGKIFLRAQTAAAHYRNHHSNNSNGKKTKTDENAMENAENPKEAEELKKNETNELSAINETTCKVCLQRYSSAATLRVHMRLHWETRPFQCDKCDRNFNKRARLNRHIAEVHSDQPIEIPCKFGCGKTFRRYDTATNHYYIKHTLPEKGIKPKENSFVCEDCGRVFKSLATLREHSYTHRPQEDRPFKCEHNECGKSFVSKRTYEDHLLRHAGIKKFECPHCGLKKTTLRELRTHVNIHTKDKKYTCPTCGKVFNRPENLRLHRRTVHDGIRRFKCRFCDQAFGKSDTLKHHEMRHTGERPHKCQICDRSFIQAVALRTHMNTHNK